MTTALRGPGLRPVYRPLGDLLLLEPFELEADAESKIIIPDMAKDRPNLGRVVAAGPQALVAEGTVVLYQRYTGVLVEELEDHVLVSQKDLLARRDLEEVLELEPSE